MPTAEPKIRRYLGFSRTQSNGDSLNSLGQTGVHDVHRAHSAAGDIEEPLVLVGEIGVEPDLGVLLLERSKQSLDHGGSVGLGFGVNPPGLEVGQGAADGVVQGRRLEAVEVVLPVQLCAITRVSHSR
jgi:hypothetical protein